MAKRVDSGPEGSGSEQSASAKSVVDLADARVRLRTRPGQPPNEALAADLDEISSLLDQGLSAEARTRLTSLINAARKQPRLLALGRCALSLALEMQGHYRESLAAVSMYEAPESRTELDEKTVQSLRVQIGLAYNYNGDHPKAIAILKAALRDFSESVTKLGPIYA